MDRRAFVERLLQFDTTHGTEAPAQTWLRDRLDELGFETYEWTADPETLAAHPSFPDEPDDAFAGRPSVGGVLEFGSGEGPTLVLNGHVDVVPANEGVWTTDPFEPSWDGDRLTARGAADMKSGLAACVFAALELQDADTDLDGRLVVESVAGEEEGGVGAAAAACSNPYPFERDACIVAEPTDLRPVVASEGSVMLRLTLTGRSAHAATRWRGEDVLSQFEQVRAAFHDLEDERCNRVRHPLYESYPVAWPVVCGTVRAGTWASTVPAEHVSEWRVGVAPGETVEEVEREVRARLDEVVAGSAWLSEHPPTLERFSVQFEPSEIAPEEPVVEAVQAGRRERGLDSVAPEGVTYGADARHYIDAGIPTALFGPGSIDEAHYPDETVDWTEVETAVDVLAAAARRYLSK